MTYSRGERRAQLQKYKKTWNCPLCGTEIHPTHDQESSRDTHRCSKCGWECQAVELWSV